MRRLCVLVLVVGMFALSSTEAWAQQTAPPGPVQDDPGAETRWNLMAGYAYLNDKAWNEHLYKGWVAALTFRLTTNVSLVGEIGGHHGEYGDTGFTIQRYALMGGMKLTGGEGRVRPFFQVLVGVTRQGGDVGLADGIAAQPGGGADLTLNERFTFRVQGDYRWMREDDTNWSAYRVSGGLIIYLGKKAR